MEFLMEFGLRDWLLVLGPVFIIGVLVHGYWRMRANRNSLKMALDKSFLTSRHDRAYDADFPEPYRAELPNGGARVVSKFQQKSLDLDEDVPVLMDAKRGDIGSTAEHYAREAFERYGADAITVNPYMGYDSLAPYLEYRDKGVFILCRTSNPGGADIQNLLLESGQRLYEHVAEQAATQWNKYGNMGLVTGATQPAELARIREITGDMPFLVPGVGAQGGDVAALMAAGQGGSLIINSSRAVLYASSAEDFAEAARATAIATRDEINEHRHR